jgi:predicted dehydrogenase
MMAKLRWGILGTAKIARTSLIPAMQESRFAEAVAVASRDADKAAGFAAGAGLPDACGSYGELLARPDIDAVYIPLPNHLHVPWSIRALEAGKHVLCEKPIALDGREARRLRDAAGRFPGLLAMEAFMYRFHPQWLRVRDWIEAGEPGRITHVQAAFTYHNTDPADIRNQAEIGGGGLMDIGCYCISAARHIFGGEPVAALGVLDHDPDFGTDRHAAGVLDFGTGTATFHCSTQSNPSQMVRITGDQAVMLVELPWVRYGDTPARLIVQRGYDRETLTVGDCNQYVKLVDAFSRAALEGRPAPMPLDDAVANMDVIDALFDSARVQDWQAVRGG